MPQTSVVPITLVGWQGPRSVKAAFDGCKQIFPRVWRGTGVVLANEGIDLGDLPSVHPLFSGALEKAKKQLVDSRRDSYQDEIPLYGSISLRIGLTVLTREGEGQYGLILSLCGHYGLREEYPQELLRSQLGLDS